MKLRIVVLFSVIVVITVVGGCGMSLLPNADYVASPVLTLEDLPEVVKADFYEDVYEATETNLVDYEDNIGSEEQLSMDELTELAMVYVDENKDLVIDEMLSHIFDASYVNNLVTLPEYPERFRYLLHEDVSYEENSIDYKVYNKIIDYLVSSPLISEFNVKLVEDSMTNISFSLENVATDVVYTYEIINKNDEILFADVADFSTGECLITIDYLLPYDYYYYYYLKVRSSDGFLSVAVTLPDLSSVYDGYLDENMSMLLMALSLVKTEDELLYLAPKFRPYLTETVSEMVSNFEEILDLVESQTLSMIELCEVVAEWDAVYGYGSTIGSFSENSSTDGLPFRNVNNHEINSYIIKAVEDGMYPSYYTILAGKCVIDENLVPDGVTEVEFGGLVHSISDLERLNSDDINKEFSFYNKNKSSSDFTFLCENKTKTVIFKVEGLLNGDVLSMEWYN